MRESRRNVRLVLIERKEGDRRKGDEAVNYERERNDNNDSDNNKGHHEALYVSDYTHSDTNKDKTTNADDSKT